VKGNSDAAPFSRALEEMMLGWPLEIGGYRRRWRS
jgi:hypothetical protein